jgi:hypothetical protein
VTILDDFIAQSAARATRSRRRLDVAHNDS